MRVQIIIDVPDGQGVEEELADVAVRAICNYSPGLEDTTSTFYMGPGISVIAVDDSSLNKGNENTCKQEMSEYSEPGRPPTESSILRRDIQDLH